VGLGGGFDHPLGSMGVGQATPLAPWGWPFFKNKNKNNNFLKNKLHDRCQDLIGLCVNSVKSTDGMTNLVFIKTT
jgi:hypothetical protein